MKDVLKHINQKKSLNDRSKSKRISNLVGMLLCFCMNKIAFITDIKKAYLQISQKTDDRDIIRFL